MHCDKTFFPDSGVRMDAVVELFCAGEFVNSTVPTEDGTQTRVTCMGDMNMTALVSTVIPKRRVRSKFSIRYRCENSFSSVTNQDLEVDGSIGTNFYQNAICNGTESTSMHFSSKGNLFERLMKSGGSFLTVHMGSCRASARLLSSIDILGVFYSFVVIPCCEPATPQNRQLYEEELARINMSCNGAPKDFREKCKGLLIGATQFNDSSVSCKCRGNWSPSDQMYNCTGELYGEQNRHGPLGSYIRSSVCAGKNVFEPVFFKDAQHRAHSGSVVTCYGAAVKSTIFQPGPIQNHFSVQRRL